MEKQELSAFEAYGLSKKDKKVKKKTSLKLNVSHTSDATKPAEGGSKRKANDLSEKSDAVWDSFVKDLHVKKKKKKVTASTPLLSLLTTETDVGKQGKNLFLGKSKKKKTKKITDFEESTVDSGAHQNNVSNVISEINGINEYSPEILQTEIAAKCLAGHLLRKGKINCKVCKRLDEATYDSDKKQGMLSPVLEKKKIKEPTSEVRRKKTGVVNGSIKQGNVKELNAKSLNMKRTELTKIDETVLPPITKTFSNSSDTIHDKNGKSCLKNSLDEGKKMLAWILSPINVDEFFEKYWEKKPLHISRSSADYFSGIFSSEDLDRALRQCPMYFGKNVDVTAYKDGVRTTENPEGRARPAAVWEKYRQGHSIRVLNPQTFIPNVGILVSTLQEFFRCMVGVNSYLTPAGTQGFAPHYDDIEAFVLQLEGEKLWKVYAPRTKEETLPRFSSPNFSQDEIGEPLLEVRLQPGDLLYFPRGYIHQARSVETHHSLHITVSTYQCNTWGDLLHKAVVAAMELARDDVQELREGLPLNFLDNFGAVYSDSESPERAKMLERLTELAGKVLEACPWDAAADQIGKQFIHDSFPTPVSDVQQTESWEKWFRKPRVSDVAVKLVSANCIRLVVEGDGLLVFYNTDNSKEYHGEEAQSFEIGVESGSIIESLLFNYPRYTKLKDLPRGEPISNAVFKKTLYQLFTHSLLLVENYF